MNKYTIIIISLTIISLGRATKGLSFREALPRVSSLEKEKFSKSNPEQTFGSLTIKPNSGDFCQLYVYFTNFISIGDVDKDGNCVGGQWTVSGQADTNVPTLCGDNSGQHLYLNFDAAGTPITMEITSNGTADWDIELTQIACNDLENLAPANCIQYHKETTGTVEGFNYRSIFSNPSPSKTYQIANQNYKVCIGQSNASQSSIAWSRPPGATNFYFTVTGDTEVTDPSLLGNIVVSNFNENCTTDYVVIQGGDFTNFDGNPQTSSRFCGVGFPPTVTSTTKPFTLTVVTNSLESSNADKGNVGFTLSYVLI